MLKTMIKTQQSMQKTQKDMLKKSGDGDLFKRKIWKNELRQKIEFRRNQHLKNINKVKIKTQKI